MQKNEVRVDQAVRTENGSVVVETQKAKKKNMSDRLLAYQNMLKKQQGMRHGFMDKPRYFMDKALTAYL